MKVFYGRAAYKRDNGHFPPLRLVNLFVEATPTTDEQIALLSRKGLTQHSPSVGTGACRGVFYQPGVFDGDVFRVVGTKLYRGATEIGAITGSGPVSFAAGSSGEIAVCGGGSLHLYDGALSTVDFPDDANVSKIIFHDGLYIAARAGSHKYYWSAVLDGSSWDALDFASAESKPDALLDLAVVNDTLWLFGEETIEPWANVGSADAPYQRFEQRIYSKGIHSTGCLVEMDQALLFVSNENIAYVMRDGPERISDHGIEEQIAASETVACFGFISEGHSFFCVRLDAATYAYDLSTRLWCEFASHNHANFRASCATKPGNAPVFGDDTDGTLWALGGYADGDEELERRFSWAIPLNGGSVSLDNLTLWANVGWTDLLSGQGSDPVAEMRTSRDAGATWGTWRSASLGSQGNYRARCQWRRLGLFDTPGAMGEIRCTDPVGLRISAVLANEPGGGRGRG